MPDTAVEIADESIVEVDISDAPNLAPADNADPVVVTEPKPRQREVKTNAADDAAAALTQAVKTAETEANARRAAEATALAERQAREQAQRLAAQSQEEAKGYREQAETSQLTIINSGIESATREVDAYGTEWERAQEAGEFSKAKEVLKKLTRASATLDRLEADKAAFVSGARKVQTTEGRVEAPQVSQSPFEQYVGGFDPKAQAWLRAHPECVPSQVGGDATKNANMMSGHYAAMAKGLQPNSDAYFQVIEEHTGHRQPVTPAAPVSGAANVIEAESPVTPKAKPRQAAPSAPVSRDAPGPNGAPQSRTVSLTPQQQDIALISFAQKQGETDTDFKKRAFGSYARELLAATAEGKIGRLTH